MTLPDSALSPDLGAIINVHQAALNLLVAISETPGWAGPSEAPPGSEKLRRVMEDLLLSRENSEGDDVLAGAAGMSESTIQHLLLSVQVAVRLYQAALDRYAVKKEKEKGHEVQ